MRVVHDACMDTYLSGRRMWQLGNWATSALACCKALWGGGAVTDGARCTYAAAKVVLLLLLGLGSMPERIDDCESPPKMDG